MATERLTVDRIAALLTTEKVSASTIKALEQDDRVAVVRLLTKWRKRQEAIRAERKRVKKLYAFEQVFRSQGCQYIAGVDEAGRGPLAGPVVTAAVILPPECYIPGLDDSKKLTADQRNELYVVIRREAVAVCHSVIDIELIDKLNIYWATVHGMYQSLAGLEPKPDAVLIDAVPLKDLTVPYKPLVHGDQLSASIAAASIIAKVERDRLMEAYDRQYPLYGFGRHKGYATPEHMEALNKCGPCPIHRQSFAPVRTWTMGSLFDED